MNPDQTASKEAVWSGFILFKILATKLHKQNREREQTTVVMKAEKGLIYKKNISDQLIYMYFGVTFEVETPKSYCLIYMVIFALNHPVDIHEMHKQVFEAINLIKLLPCYMLSSAVKLITHRH